VRAQFDSERSLKNLLEQIALKNAGWRTDAQTLAFLQQDNLVSIFPGEVELVSDDDDGVTIFCCESAERDQ